MQRLRHDGPVSPPYSHRFWSPGMSGIGYGSGWVWPAGQDPSGVMVMPQESSEARAVGTLPDAREVM